MLQTCLKSRNNGLRVVYSITINPVPNHLDKRAHKPPRHGASGLA
ncbi:hypothetical protein LNQ03_22050 [Klebsiella pneumoniae subsp. pneumoniae]|nr:hypothetical protein [Klebsiella pneumoniae subsp. pneumoniae]